MRLLWEDRFACANRHPRADWHRSAAACVGRGIPQVDPAIEADVAMNQAIGVGRGLENPIAVVMCGSVIVPRIAPGALDDVRMGTRGRGG